MTELVIDNPEACGLGGGEKCCAFLVMGGLGFQCGRTLPGVEMTVMLRLLQGTMVAKYDPGELPFPQCQEARAVSFT